MTTGARRTTVFVDGFNLYYGCLKGTAYRWLDLDALCRKLLPRNDIARIRYFTARVQARPDSPGQEQRQLTYLRALRAHIPHLTIHEGKFLSSQVMARVVDPPPAYIKVYKTEEKGSDVNIASYLLMDAVDGDYETAVVISNDTDLCTPIAMVRQRFGLPVLVYRPRDYFSYPLAQVATSYRPIRQGVLRASQLPATLTDQHGTIHKPATW